MLRTIVASLAAAGALALAGCEDPAGSGGRGATADPSATLASAAWQSREQLHEGRNLYMANCAGCHGRRLEGAPNWRKTDASGNYPPPPLDGTGHTWHHPLPVLRKIVAEGGPVNMPAWGDRMSPDQIDSVLAYVSSTWPDDIYENWAERQGSR